MTESPTVTAAHRSGASEWLVGVSSLTAVLLLFFAVPVHSGQTAGRLMIDLALSALAVGVVSAVIVREAKRHLSGESGRTGFQLVLLLEIVLLVFALAYYTVATNTAGQFDGLGTRIDALYFTMSTMATVGFGDVHAKGQFARALVTAHLVFNIAFVAGVGALVRSRVQSRSSGTDR